MMALAAAPVTTLTTYLVTCTYFKKRSTVAVTATNIVNAIQAEAAALGISPMYFEAVTA